MQQAISGSRWFWVITAANVAVCALLIVFIGAILSVLAAFAAGVTEWPVAALLVAGVVLSAVSWPLTKRVPSRRKRWFGRALNGSACAVYVLVLVTVAGMLLHATRRRFLVPAGFQGELVLVHAPNHGEKGRKGLLRTTYEFPSSGILITPDPAPTGLFSDQYEYIYPNGRLQRLGDAGPGTLQDTPENRANTHEVVTYFGRSSSGGAHNCSTEEISIGTRALLLGRRNNPPPPPLDAAICP
jgi:hypothetical protein